MQQIGIKKNDILENILVEKLVFSGQGFAKLKHSNKDLDGRVIMISGGAIPGSLVNLRVLKKKKSYIEAQITEIIKASPIEIENVNNKFGMSGAWKWINIPYSEQLKIKKGQIEESFNNLKKYNRDLKIEDIIPSPIIEGYRNKVEFSFGKYISHREGVEKHFNVGFHRPGDFSKVEDFDGTPLIDELQNEIYLNIKNYLKTLGLPVYDSMKGEGFFRHLLIRKTYFTNEIMIILGFNPLYFTKNTKLNKDEKLHTIKDFFASLASKYNNIKSIYFSHNGNKADIAIGDLELIYGEKIITEKLLSLEFNISPNSFFQTNSSGAEKLYSAVLDLVGETSIKDKIILDLYAGTGTIGMLFARASAKKVISVEMVSEASRDGEENARLNNLDNIEFVNDKTEKFLRTYLKNNEKADLIVIDPPRAGMHPDALSDILKFGVAEIIYVSCNPATLVRDLEYITKNSDYRIDKIIPIDMFPHTHHIETIVRLIGFYTQNV